MGLNLIGDIGVSVTVNWQPVKFSPNLGIFNEYTVNSINVLRVLNREKFLNSLHPILRQGQYVSAFQPNFQ